MVWLPITVLRMEAGFATAATDGLISSVLVDGRGREAGRLRGVFGSSTEKPYYTGSAFAQVKLLPIILEMIMRYIWSHICSCPRLSQRMAP